MKKLILVVFACASAMAAGAQDIVRYRDDKRVNIDYLHGQFAPAVGVHNIEVLRANRERPESAEGLGWTYNHAPMIAYWQGKFWVEYLANPVGEHMMPGISLLTSSDDGYAWSRPQVVFPEYKLPVGIKKPGRSAVSTEGMTAVMHQRSGFYVSKNGRLLCLGYYGVSITPEEAPNKGDGIGRVVREIKADGTFGPIHFIRYNQPYGPKNTDYPFYKSSKDKGFVSACDELLANRLQTMQWVEEQDEGDPLVGDRSMGKAFAWYRLDDGRIVGLWKTGRTAISDDEGKTWSSVKHAPGVINGNAKMWGQRTSDGKFALVYNPSLFRWPMALNVSDDGLNFREMWLVHGDGQQMRYGGHFKDYGPQYLRGIVEGNGTPPDGNMWVTYSVNKEDIWVARIPVPIAGTVTEPVSDDFDRMPAGRELDRWNIYSPVWARTGIETHNGKRMLTLRDKDPCNYAKAERVFPESSEASIGFTLVRGDVKQGELLIELQDAKGTAAVQIVADARTGDLKVRRGAKFTSIAKMEPGRPYEVKLALDCRLMRVDAAVDGGEAKRITCFAPVGTVQRLVFRTGNPMVTQGFYDPEPVDDLPGAGIPLPEAVWRIGSVSAAPARK